MVNDENALLCKVARTSPSIIIKMQKRAGHGEE
jgi:hypothetical protein